MDGGFLFFGFGGADGFYVVVGGFVEDASFFTVLGGSFVNVAIPVSVGAAGVFKL